MSNTSDATPEAKGPVRWKPKAADLVGALTEHYLPSVSGGLDEWSLLTEVPSTGFPGHQVPHPDWETIRTAAHAAGDDPDQAWQDAVARWQACTTIRSIDVLLIRNWRSGTVPFERIAVEIKVSRADFRAEIAVPAKRAPWEQMTHKFAYCVPAGLIAPEEVPAGCWLIEISEHPCAPDQSGHSGHAPTRVHWSRKVRGTRNRPGPLPVDVSVFFARAASRAEHAIRRADGAAASARATAEVARLRARVAALQDREQANRDRVAKALALVAPLGEQTCSDCGEPIRPQVPTRYGQASWRHKGTAQEQACYASRALVGRFGAHEVIPALLVAEYERAAAEAALSHDAADTGLYRAGH